MKRLLFIFPISLYTAQQKPYLTLQRVRQERQHFEGLLKQHSDMSFTQKMELHNKINKHASETRTAGTQWGKTNPKLSRALGAEVRKLLLLLQKIW